MNSLNFSYGSGKVGGVSHFSILSKCHFSAYFENMKKKNEVNFIVVMEDHCQLGQLI